MTSIDIAKHQGKPPLIVILGPTASGKTNLGIGLAKKFSGEIVSADSRQVYRGMDIGTDKVSGTYETREGEDVLIASGIPHYLIDICDPDEDFTLADYQKRALAIIENIQKQGRLPFLVGGTGLYISSLVDNYQLPQGKPDNDLRKSLEEKSVEDLLSQLRDLQPSLALKVDTKNKRRLIRAIEMAFARKTEGQEESFFAFHQKGEQLFDTLQIGIRVDREHLCERINARVDEQIERGLLQEAKALLEKYPLPLPAFSGIGYKQMIQHLHGDISLPEAVRIIKRDTRRYAKRQMTWWRRDKRILWVESAEEAENLVRNYLSGRK